MAERQVEVAWAWRRPPSWRTWPTEEKPRPSIQKLAYAGMPLDKVKNLVTPEGSTVISRIRRPLELVKDNAVVVEKKEEEKKPAKKRASTIKKGRFAGR